MPNAFQLINRARWALDLAPLTPIQFEAIIAAAHKTAVPGEYIAADLLDNHGAFLRQDNGEVWMHSTLEDVARRIQEIWNPDDTDSPSFGSYGGQVTFEVEAPEKVASVLRKSADERR